MFAELLVDGLIKSSLLLALAAAACFTLRRASAAVRHLVWALGLGSLLVLPLASLALPAWPVPLLPDAIPALASAIGYEPVRAAPAAVEPASSQPRALPAAGVSAAPAAGTAAGAPRAIAWLPALWLLGTLLIAARFSGGVLRLWWVERRSAPVTGRWSALAQDLARQLGLGRRFALLESRDASVPLTWGIWRPVVLLPSGFERWPLERFRIVLSHELVHVKRGDCRTQMMAQLACALYWFNPLAWMAARRLRMERERACDDQVLRAGVRPAVYADHLLAIARSLVSAPGCSFAAVAMARRSQLEGRLLAILDRGRRRRSLSRLASALAFTLALAIVAPLAALDFGDRAAAAGQRGGASGSALIADLESDDRKVREQAAKRLAREGGPAAVEPLIAALTDEHWPVRKYAAFALVQIGDRRAVEPLLKALRDPVWHVREQAAVALGQIGDPRAAEPLRQVLTDPDWHVREQAALALRRLGNASPPSAPDPAVAALLRDPDWRVRQQAVISLAARGASSTGSYELLLAGLQDADWHVREVTAAQLGRLRDTRGVEPLIAALQDADWHVRGQAASALGLIGDHRAVAPLRALLRDAVDDVRDDARKALQRLTR